MDQYIPYIAHTKINNEEISINGNAITLTPIITASIDTSLVISFFSLIFPAIYGILGISYPFLSLFVLDRMLNKSRIMACSNAALYAREVGCVSAYCVGYCSLFLGPIAIFIWMGISMALSSTTIPIGEEKTRQNLVDFLQNNEKASRQVVLDAKYK